MSSISHLNLIVSENYAVKPTHWTGSNAVNHSARMILMRNCSHASCSSDHGIPKSRTRSNALRHLVAETRCYSQLSEWLPNPRIRYSRTRGLTVSQTIRRQITNSMGGAEGFLGGQGVHALFYASSSQRPISSPQPFLFGYRLQTRTPSASSGPQNACARRICKNNHCFFE